MASASSARENIFLVLIRRHPFLTTSLALHLLLIVFLLYLYVPEINGREYYVGTPVQQAKVTASLEKARQLAMQKDLDNLQTIKDLLKDSRGQQESVSAVDGKPDDLQAPSVKAERELAAEAKQLAAEIQAIEQQLKAEELATILNIPQSEALKQVQQDQQQEATANTDEMQPDELADHVASLEAQARNILAQRQMQMDRQQNGSRINTADNQKSSGNQQAGAENGQQQGAQAEPGGDGAPVIDQKINQFLNGHIPMAKSMGDGGTDFFLQGSGHIPAVDSANIRRAEGRMLGAGAEFASRFYVNTWYLIGPFGGIGSSIFANQQFPPEKAIDLDAVYRGKNNRLLQWQYFTSNEYPLVPPEAEEFAVFYGYTEIHVDREMDAWLWIGIDDTGKVWLNDHEVYDGININKGWFFDEVYHRSSTAEKDFNLTEAKVPVRFQKGVNKFLFKVSNASRHMFFSLVITK